MPRNMIQDVVPPNRRSIKRIPLPKSKQRVLVPATKNIEEDIEKESPSLPYTRESYRPEYNPEPDPMPSDENKKGISSLWLWLGTAVVIAVLFFTFSYFYSGVTLTITPREETLALTSEISAKKGTGADFSYDVMTLSKEGEKLIPATGKQDVQKKASGQIIIYNSANSAPQTLVQNTRFETPTGLIFRISKSVTVPGQTIQNGKKIPGSVEVTVVADKPGVDYNIPQTDFTIPGFKGDPRYKTFYVRSKTAMAGGFVGVMNAVTDDARNTARESLHSELKAQLMSEAKAQKPASVTVYDTLAVLTYESLPETNSPDGNSVTLHEKATLSIPLFKTDDISKVAGQTLFGTPTAVSVANPESLTATLLGNPIDIMSGAFSFTLSGQAHLLWRIDHDVLYNALLGKSRSDLESILKKFPEVAKADITFRPFWRSTFPTNKKDFTFSN